LSRNIAEYPSLYSSSCSERRSPLTTTQMSGSAEVIVKTAKQIKILMFIGYAVAEYLKILLS